jgi:hypothetical protein
MFFGIFHDASSLEMATAGCMGVTTRSILEYALRHVMNETFQGNLRIFHFECGGKQISWMICLHDLCKVRQDIHTAALHGLKHTTTMQLLFFTHRLLTSCFCLFNHLSLSGPRYHPPFFFIQHWPYRSHLP